MCAYHCIYHYSGWVRILHKAYSEPNETPCGSACICVGISHLMFPPFTMETCQSLWLDLHSSDFPNVHPFSDWHFLNCVKFITSKNSNSIKLIPESTIEVESFDIQALTKTFQYLQGITLLQEQLLKLRWFHQWLEYTLDSWRTKKPVYEGLVSKRVYIKDSYVM